MPVSHDDLKKKIVNEQNLTWVITDKKRWNTLKFSIISYLGFFFSVPSAGPVVIAVHNTSSTSVFIQLEPIPKNEIHGILLEYEVNFAARLELQQRTPLTACSNSTSAVKQLSHFSN